MTKWDPDFEAALISAPNYRAFIALFFKKSRPWSQPKQLSFQKFATSAGFAAKSYIHDVIKGRKSITAKSLEKVVAGLKLPKDWAEYFRLLVAVDEPQLRPQNRIVEDIHALLVKRRRRLSRRQHELSVSAPSLLSRITLEEHTTDICVAVGDPTKGASLDEIAARVNLPRAVVTRCLKRMLGAGLIRYDQDHQRYHNIPTSMNVKHSFDDTAYRDFIWGRMLRCKRRMQGPNSKLGLFSTQTFGVKLSSMAALSAELDCLIREFADHADDEQGDGIGEVLVTLTHNFDR
ncbi:MAG: hypothetical protein AB7N80_10730 [Bdellovibrionales bacterium]